MIRAQECRARAAVDRNEEKAIPVLDHEPADDRTSCAAGRNHRNPAVRIDAVVCRNRLIGSDAAGSTAVTVDVVVRVAHALRRF
jgi:hypothetical protein